MTTRHTNATMNRVTPKLMTTGRVASACVTALVVGCMGGAVDPAPPSGAGDGAENPGVTSTGGESSSGQTDVPADTGTSITGSADDADSTSGETECDDCTGVVYDGCQRPDHVTELGALVDGMQPGTFAELEANWPGGTPETLLKQGAGNVFQFADSAPWDPTLRQLFYYGAGHGADEPKLVIYDDDTNTWSQGISSYHPGHGYDHNTIDEVRSLLYTAKYNSTQQWRYHILEGAWEQLPDTTYSGNGLAVARAYTYFPPLGLVVIDANDGVVQYLEDDESWTTLASTLYDDAGGGSYYHNFAEYNPTYDELLFGGGNSPEELTAFLWKLTADGEIERLADAPFPLQIASSGSAGGQVTFEPATSRFIVFGNDDHRLHEYDMVTDHWRELDVELPPPMRDDANGAGRNMIATPLCTYGAIVYTKYASSATSMWVYKHAEIDR